MKDQTEVCPLSRGVMLPAAQPLSLPLPEGLRFFRPPLPAALSVGLTAHVPWGERYGLTKFRRRHRMGTVRSFHRWCWVPMSRDTSPREPTTVRGISIVASGLVNGVYQAFACAHHPIHPSPAPHDAWRSTVASRRQRQRYGCGYVVRGQSTGRYLPASPPRVLVMGHQVRSWLTPCRTMTQATSCRTTWNQSRRCSACGLR
jgi:hypothetical protein